MLLFPMNYRKFIYIWLIEYHLPSFFTNYLLSEPFSAVQTISIVEKVGSSIFSKAMINSILI